MWRRIHILGPLHSFALASFGAAIIAIPFAIRDIDRNEANVWRDFLWSHQFNPYTTFAIVFLCLLPILLGYYHLGRLGVILSLAFSFAIYCIVAVGAILLLMISRPVWVAAASYAGFIFLLYVLLLWLHMKAVTSQRIQDAQQALRLTR